MADPQDLGFDPSTGIGDAILFDLGYLLRPQVRSPLPEAGEDDVDVLGDMMYEEIEDNRKNTSLSLSIYQIKCENLVKKMAKYPTAKEKISEGKITVVQVKHHKQSGDEETAIRSKAVARKGTKRKTGTRSASNPPAKRKYTWRKGEPVRGAKPKESQRERDLAEEEAKVRPRLEMELKKEEESNPSNSNSEERFARDDVSIATSYREEARLRAAITKELKKHARKMLKAMGEELIDPDGESLSDSDEEQQEENLELRNVSEDDGEEEEEDGLFVTDDEELSVLVKKYMNDLYEMTPSTPNTV